MLHVHAAQLLVFASRPLGASARPLESRAQSFHGPRAIYARPSPPQAVFGPFACGQVPGRPNRRKHLHKALALLLAGFFILPGAPSAVQSGQHINLRM